jgi:hypothetical protein
MSAPRASNTRTTPKRNARTAEKATELLAQLAAAADTERESARAAERARIDAAALDEHGIAPSGVPRPRVSPICEHVGCTTHARNVVTVTADGGLILPGVKLCQRHTLALGARGEVTGAVR